MPLPNNFISDRLGFNYHSERQETYRMQTKDFVATKKLLILKQGKKIIDKLHGNKNCMIEHVDPIARFAKIFAQAQKVVTPEPAAMVLATVDAEGRPSARVVLLKGFDEKGFVFYTNLESRKARDLIAVPFAALCFYWPQLSHQVRVEGRVEPVSEAEADAYFATRPRGAQIGAWASKQSRTLTSREELETRVKAVEEKFAGREVVRPPFWSGFRVIPSRLEFWESRENRLHDRVVYLKENGAWRSERLYP
jgi:pyridoxamine 5'-phosphate oxidase